MGDIYTNPPQSRNEAILRATIDGTEYTAPPQSRIEDLLLELKEAIEQGGTGEGDMKKSIYDSDNAVATAGGIKMFVNSKIGTLPQRVGSLETTAGVLEGEVASIEDTLDNLGTASTKNSTSVVTQSTDLVESGAVYDAIEDLYSHIGYLSTPVPAYVARQAPKRFKDITNDWFSGSLRTEIASGDFKNIIPGDYVIDPTTGSKFYVANLDGRIGLGDKTNNSDYPAYGTHHVNFMLEKAGSGATRMWQGYGYSDKSWRVSANDKNRCPWNAGTDVDPTDSEAIGSNSTNITRSYNGTNMSAYMGSFIRQRIDEILLPLFQSVFGSSNILKYREWNSNAINTSAVSPAQTDWTGIASGCAWVDRYLDLPSEIELYGARIASSSYRDVGCQCEKLPLFDGAMLYNIFPRMDVWTKAVASSSYACDRNYYGLAYANNASNAYWACPLACVK